jgi:hypothetical protein
VENTELETLKAKKLQSEIDREMAEREKIELESKHLRQEFDSKYLSNKELIRPIVAGVAVAIFFAAYFKLILVPTQLSLVQRLDTAEFKLQQNEAEYRAKLATLELKKEQIEVDSKKSKIQLELAQKRLSDASNLNKIIADQIDKFSNKKTQTEVDKIKTDTTTSSRKIESQIAEINAQTMEVQLLDDNLAEKTNVQTGVEGWIYIGYFPNSEWEYRNIKIDTKEEVGLKQYEVINNVNFRSQYPKLTWKGYDYGTTSGFLIVGQTVEILEPESVGNSKVWARVKVL